MGTRWAYTKKTVKAFNSGLRVLCAIGIRAILEGICKEQGMPSRDLFGKISDLVKQRIITESSSDVLHQLRFLGNDAAHELDEPLRDDLRAAMSIVDNIIENLYEIPKHKERLVKRKIR